MLTRKDIERAVADIAPAYDITRVYLFGSYARYEQTDSSDVDLLIEPGASLSLFGYGGFCDTVENMLGSKVDVITGSDALRQNVRSGFEQDKVLLYEHA